MPQFIPWVIATIGTYIGGTVGAMMVMYAVEIATAAVLLGGLALSNSQSRRAQRKARDAYNAAQVDRMANVVTTLGQRELVMGRVRKAGTVFFRGSTGTNKETFVMCMALAGHEIDAVETIYLNDVPVTLDADGHVTSEPYTISRKVTVAAYPFTGSTVTLPFAPIEGTLSATTTVGTGMDAMTALLTVSVSGTTVTITTDGSTPFTDSGVLAYQYIDNTSKCRIRVHLGAADQAADAGLIALFPDSWTSEHRARGVAYLVAEFDYDETAYATGLPALSAVVRGAKIFDPRSATTAWTENPALMARHLLTHYSFGQRGALTAAEETRIAVAANACDTVTSYVVGGDTVSRPLFTAGIVIPYGAQAKDALDDVCQAMAGMWAYAGGEFFIRAGVYTAPVLSLTEADLAVVKRSGDGSVQQQPVVIGTHKARAEKVNNIVPRIWDSEQDYKQVALTPLASAALVTRDGGAWLSREVEMPAVTFAPQALHVAGIIMRDERDPLTVTLPFKMRAYPVQLFEVISLTLPRYGWSAKAFMVLGRSWTLDGLLQLTLKETAAAIFQLDAEFLPQGYAPNTELPRPWEILPPTIISVESGTDVFLFLNDGTVVPRVKVTWAPITDQSLLQGGQVEVFYRLAADAGWRVLRVPATETWIYLQDLNGSNVVYIQARTRNAVAVSDWTPLIVHTVTGNTGAPAAPTGLSALAIIGAIRVSWVNPTNTDLRHVEVWMGTTSTLGAATKVAEILGTIYDHGPLLTSDGARYFWVRAVNNSGNASAYAGPVSATAAAVESVDLGTGVIANKFSTAYLYQWATSTPGDPSGTSIFNWSNGSGSSYTGGNGWSTTIPANPGTPLLQLWLATKQVTDVPGATSTSVSWATGFAVWAAGANGAAGLQTAEPAVYKWAATIPTITGTATYTWATAGFTAPSGWSKTISTSPTPGFTLWKATVNLTDAATATTSSINWATASIVASGYAGGDGLSARVCFARVASNPTPTSGSIATSGNSTFPSSAQSTTTWGFAATWAASDPSPSSTNSLYQSDGIYDPSTDLTTWGTPYISALKVGSLSAVSVNTGALTVDGVLTVGTTGSFKLGQTAYNTGSGIWFGYAGGQYKWSIGDGSTKYLRWNGSLLDCSNLLAYDLVASNASIDNTPDPTRPSLTVNANAIGPSTQPAIKITTNGTSHKAIDASGGAIASAAGFEGNLTGNVTGNVTGNLTGTATNATKLNYSGVGEGAVYASNSGGTPNSYKATMQTDGNFVIFHGATPYWDAQSDLSDRRLKKAVRATRASGMDVINALRVVDFKWKVSAPVKSGGQRHTGFIAQDVRGVVPDAVKDIGGTLLLHKEELVPYIVKALQEHEAELQRMRARIRG